MEGEMELYSVPIEWDHLPATIVSVRVNRGQSVERGTIVALYEYTKEAVVEQDDFDGGRLLKPRKVVEKRRMKGEVRTQHSGTVKQLVTVGEEIKSPSQPVAVVNGCSHGIQLGGLCCICGEEVSATETVQTTVPITHDASGLTVSEEIAQSIEKENAERLLKSRKLSLILDLDQTIIHATVNPGVGALMDGKSQEQFQDVRRFVLPDSRGTYYYIKLRPHTIHFLQEVTKKYELHIYTMGTRNYARQVAHEIDPDSRLFNERILSRDDSGNFAQKSIQRLFPCDQSMVVVVDDRADVWMWSPNLVKVRPYEFFSETGDINAPLGSQDRIQQHQQHQPQQQPQDQQLPSVAEQSMPSRTDNSTTSAALGESPVASPASTTDSDTTLLQTSDSIPTSDQLPPPEGVPLEPPAADALPPQVNGSLQSTSARALRFSEETDDHLLKILDVLNKVHERFYRAVDADSSTSPDVRQIVPDLKRNVLKGCVLVFTGVIPLNAVDPRRHEIWRMAESFGATCQTELDGRVTHLLAVKEGTNKLNKARSMPGVHIVRPSWLVDSAEKWQRLPESEYAFIGDGTDPLFRAQSRPYASAPPTPPWSGTATEEELSIETAALEEVERNRDVEKVQQAYDEGLLELDEMETEDEEEEDEGLGGLLGKRKNRDEEEDEEEEQEGAKNKRQRVEEEEDAEYEELEGIVDQEMEEPVEPSDEDEIDYLLEHDDDDETGSQASRRSVYSTATNEGISLNELFRERRLQRQRRVGRGYSRFQSPITDLVAFESEEEDQRLKTFPLIDLSPGEGGVPVTEVVVVGGPKGTVQMKVGDGMLPETSFVDGMDTDGEVVEIY